MGYTAIFIEEAKKKTGIKSDYGIAKALGVKQSQICDWKKGRSEASTIYAVMLCVLAGIDMKMSLKIMSEHIPSPHKNRAKEVQECILC